MMMSHDEDDEARHACFESYLRLLSSGKSQRRCQEVNIARSAFSLGRSRETLFPNMPSGHTMKTGHKDTIMDATQTSTLLAPPTQRRLRHTVYAGHDVERHRGCERVSKVRSCVGVPYTRCWQKQGNKSHCSAISCGTSGLSSLCFSLAGASFCIMAAPLKGETEGPQHD